MRTFAVVAVRLIGLWIVASSLDGVVFVTMDLTRGVPLHETFGPSWIQQVAFGLTAPVVGILLIALSRPIAGFVVMGIPENAPAPDAPSERAFSRIGVFLLGLYMFVMGLPFVLETIWGRGDFGWSRGIHCGLGLVLMIATAPIGGLIQRLRS